MPFREFSLTIKGKICRYHRPLAMAIVNATDDSFYEASRGLSATNSLEQTIRTAIDDGADILDIGACSTRPGSQPPAPNVEIDRLGIAMDCAHRVMAETGRRIPISIDTYRAPVARTAVEEMGADIINDVSGGTLDDAMIDTIASLRVPYIMMHMRGTPATMRTLTDYPDGVVADVIRDLAVKVYACRQAGIADVIVDPGFGLFAKNIEQNYQLLRGLNDIVYAIDAPLLVGLSRKSMLSSLLDIPTSDTLEATVAANTLALAGGASILRVHDVRAAIHTIRVFCATMGVASQDIFS